MINRTVGSFYGLKEGREEKGKQTRLSHTRTDFPFSVLCLEKQQLIRLARVKLRGAQGSRFLVPVQDSEK